MLKAVSEVRLGVFAKTFARPSPEGVFDALASHGLRETQFNTSVAGLSPLPDEIAPALADRVRVAAAEREIALVAVSGTFNMIQPRSTASPWPSSQRLPTSWIRPRRGGISWTRCARHARRAGSAAAGAEHEGRLVELVRCGRGETDGNGRLPSLGLPRNRGWRGAPRA